MKQLFLLLSAVALLLSFTACQSTQQQAIRVNDYQGAIRVACVGDSITYGAGVENREENNYPAALGRLLGPRFEVKNLGVNGATLLKRGDIPYWDLPEFRTLGAFAPQAVVIKLGTNDSKPENWKFQNEFPNDLRAMIDYFRGLPGQPKIWICYPAPVYETRWGITEAVVKGEIIPIIKLVAWEKAVPIIDLHRALSGRPDLFPDKIHPNAAGAAEIARTVHAALLGK